MSLRQSRLSCSVVAVMPVLMVFASATSAQQDTDRPYPEGRRFALGLYSIHTVEEMNEAGPAGWNMGHRYRFAEDYLPVIEEAGWTCLAHLNGQVKEPVEQPPPPTKPENAEQQAANAEERGETGVRHVTRLRSEAELKADIERLAAHDAVAWWDLPEEQRFWRKNEYQIVKDLSAWTRKSDPRKRPNFMYLPGHYRAEAVANYVAYLDIIGTGTYTEYAHQPRAWVRWRTEETIRGIDLAGYKIGPDYLNGQKTPIGIPMLFGSDLSKAGLITPVEAYHDFWSCIASGAKGILVFSYWHKRDQPVFETTWQDGYRRAALNLTSGSDLDQAILFGDDVELDVAVTKGSPRTSTFRPYGLDEDISLPSVNVLGKRYEGKLFVIAVSSQERPVTAKISGLPAGLTHLEVLFEKRPEEEGGNTVTVSAGTIEERFPWLTVHIYRGAWPE